MKRKALLTIADFSARKFEIYSSRGLLPVVITDQGHSNYSLADAFALRLLSEVGEVTSLENAAHFARKALDALRPINPMSFTNAEEMVVALVFYAWPDAPEGWDCRAVIGGRWQDLQGQIAEKILDPMPGAYVTAMLTVSASRIGRHVYQEARDFGLPEGEMPPAIPEDLTGYPEWFKTAERARRQLAQDWDA